jgi:hypothetical protein
MLKPWETIGKGAHIPASLDIVLTTKRIQAASVSPDVPGQKTKIDQRKNIVDADDMFRDAQRPADLCAISACVGLCEIADQIGADTTGLLGILKRVFVDMAAKILEATGGVSDESGILQIGGEDFAGDSIR